jgi:hypothetical protein
VFIMEKFRVGPVLGRGLDPGCGVGRDCVSQVPPFSIEATDSLPLVLIVGLCVGAVYAVIVGVYQGADVYVVPL